MAISISHPDRPQKAPEDQPLGQVEAPVIYEAINKGDMTLQGLHAYLTQLLAKRAAEQRAQHVGSNVIDITDRNDGEVQYAQEAA